MKFILSLDVLNIAAAINSVIICFLRVFFIIDTLTLYMLSFSW